MSSAEPFIPTPAEDGSMMPTKENAEGWELLRNRRQRAAMHIHKLPETVRNKLESTVFAPYHDTKADKIKKIMRDLQVVCPSCFSTALDYRGTNHVYLRAKRGGGGEPLLKYGL